MDSVLGVLALGRAPNIKFVVVEEPGFLLFNFEYSIVYGLRESEDSDRFFITRFAGPVRCRDE